MTKKVILIAVTCAASLAFWFTLRPLLESQDSFQEWLFWFWPFVFGAILAALTGLSFVFLPRSWRLLTIALNILAFWFVFGWDPVLLGGAAASFLFAFSAMNNISGDSGNRLKFSLSSLLRPGMGRLVTSFLILVSVAYFVNGGVQDYARNQQLPTGIQRTIQVVVGNLIGENLETQTPRARAQTSQEVTSQLASFLKPYFKFLPPVLAFSLFLVLQGLSAVFVWLAIFAAWLIFLILKSLGAVKVTIKQKEAEVIVF